MGHVDAQDTAAMAAAALTEPIEHHAGDIYLVTGPERLTFAESPNGSRGSSEGLCVT